MGGLRVMSARAGLGRAQTEREAVGHLGDPIALPRTRLSGQSRGREFLLASVVVISVALVELAWLALIAAVVYRAFRR